MDALQQSPAMALAPLLHSLPVPSPKTCREAFVHDSTTEVLSSLIVVGLIISYLPQVSLFTGRTTRVMS